MFKAAAYIQEKIADDRNRDWRNWTVVAHTANSITFSLTDPDGKEGFPGEVVSYVTYTLGNCKSANADCKLGMR